MSRALEIARRAERFEEVERADPWMAFVHLMAACAWLVALSIDRAPEGIAFGLLAAVAAIRAPSTAPLYPGLFGCAAFVLLVAFAEWQGLSTLWSGANGLGLSDVVPRFVLVPLMLWPLMHRWRVLLAAFVLAATVHGTMITAFAMVRNGWQPANQNWLVSGEIGITGLVLAVGTASLFARPGPDGWLGWLGRLAAAVGTVSGAVMLGQRMPTIAAMIGAGTSFARPARRAWSGIAALAAVVLASVAISGALLMSSARGRQWIDLIERTVTTEGFVSDREELFRVSSARIPLAMVAIDIWKDHPVIGAGARGFPIGNKARASIDPENYGIPQAHASQFPSLKCAHNAFLDEAAERGIVGVALLVALMGACWRGAWRLDPWSGTAGMMATWTVACLTQSMTVRGVPMMLLAVIVTRVCAVEREL